MDLGVGEWDLYFVVINLLLLTRIQVSGLGAMGPLVTIVLNGKSQMSTRLLHLG